MIKPGMPDAQGLYDPRFEHDACGVGFVASIKGERSHQIIRMGLQVLENLTHRGAVGADPLDGDGAGILMQLPHHFLREECARLGIYLPPAGEYGVGMVFLPQDPSLRSSCQRTVEQMVAEEGQLLLGWRDLPVRHDVRLGYTANGTQPVIKQVFVGERHRPAEADPNWLERKLYVIRRRVEKAVMGYQTKDVQAFYIPSFSSRTIVYKGMFLAEQVSAFFPDLTDERVASAFAMVHQRYSTNTFPTWDLAHPFRMMCHNGEINTLRGNINWMKAREAALASPLFGEDLRRLFPIIREGLSDSASFDRALEFLVLSGRSLPHAMMMMIPEAWENHQHMDEARKGFYEYHASLMEPWDGPAAVAFTDGRMIGATLDRNGLRPARYQILKNGLCVMASEAGTLTFPPEEIEHNGRLQPGRMFVIDLEQGRIIDDAELKQEMVTRRPYRQWVQEGLLPLDQLPEGGVSPSEESPLLLRQQVFGYTEEDLNTILVPMATSGEEPVGSMGNDAALAVLSERPVLLFAYFKQLFAQVTNPPIDPIREEMVMSLYQQLGLAGNLLEETPEHARRVRLKQPILTNAELEKLRALNLPELRAATFPTHFAVADGPAGLETALKKLLDDVVMAVDDGVSLVILSDRGSDAEHAPIPSLLATAAVHHHLIRAGKRGRASLVVESGEPREVHHFALLVGYGAGAINPWLVFESLEDLCARRILPLELTPAAAAAKFIKAVDKGLLKVFSKMGISTLQSYCGAQIFEALGLAKSMVERHFTGTVSRIEGVGVAEVGEETLRRHQRAHLGNVLYMGDYLEVGGDYKFRHGGERHMWTPLTISTLQRATQENRYATFKEFTRLIDEQSRSLCTLRGMLRLRLARTPLPLEQVEPAAAIVKRFVTGAMSFGSISKEAHETLAVAMNRMGAMSNTGEGGEDPERFLPRPNGDFARSAVKQVASGRFGVSSHYLANASEMQIKIAQGAKPGEGGQLPGHKVNEVIARTRNTTPGVTLISPPPHHDIYSIEDLAQLIFDLKNVNPQARVSVKLVAEVGVGTVAAGVSKGHADMILISGGDGGTGASPMSSIKHAGLPWELGLSETQQTLVLNDLRGRVRLQVDGQLRTGRDVVIGALLGAEEFGFATAPLVVEGCIMMRKCHLGTCPVGVATQDLELRKKFTGQPQNVVNYFFFVANEVREWLAALGYRSLDEIVGRVDLLEADPEVSHWKARKLDLSAILKKPEAPARIATRWVQPQDHGINKVLDHRLLDLASRVFENQKPLEIRLPIQNTDRTVGAMLGGVISKRFGAEGLPEDTIRCFFEGVAGQSFGAFNVRGVSLHLEGAANDYVGKGMSGGRIVIYPSRQAGFLAESNIVVGNTLLYGATGGEAYFAGMAGERFAVRNSGAKAVVEGLGDHGCEYMTGGVVVVLGHTGRNFAAGMSGGLAYVYDDEARFSGLCNPAMVSLEALEEEDRTVLRQMVERHRHFTGSVKAAALLADWKQAVGRFVKVMPHEYKRVLAELKRKVANG